MQVRKFVFHGVLSALVVLSAVGLGLGAESPALPPVSDTTDQRGPALKPLPRAEHDKRGYSHAAGQSQDISAAEPAGRPCGVSYQYDALGRIQEIVRVPSR